MQKNYEDTKHHFSIRKLTIGAASVLIGTTFYLTSGNIVHADTFTPASDQQESSALNNDLDDSTKIQANLDNQTDDINRSETDAISESSKKSDSAMKNTDSQSANITIDNTQVIDNNIQKTEKLSANAVSSSIQNEVEQTKLVKTAQVANDTQDVKFTPTFAPVNANDWNTQIDGDEFLITGYKGSDTTSNLTIPNSADFEKAGINTNNLQTFVHVETVKNLIRNGIAPKLSDTDGQKVALLRQDYGNNNTDTFSYSNLTDISGLANADISKIGNMRYMFWSNQISDLSPLANWNVSHVTNMSSMFINNQISDLSPLANWNVSNVTNMAQMFHNNQISDLAPLSNWDVSHVTNMDLIFESNQISDLTPLSNWNVNNVIHMDSMFWDNQISDLAPLSNWDVSHVTDMANMFYENKISDLAPLSNWDVSHVTDMSFMFWDNQISDLTPLSNWNVTNVTIMYSMFAGNQIKTGDLSKWNMSKVANTYDMIDPTSPVVIYLGNNTNLPTNFMDSNNSNIFTTSNGGHLIVTSNPKLLANPNKAFNKITFSDGTTANTPVFIKADNNSNEAILNAVKQAVESVMATKKAELEKANPGKNYILTIATDTTDPITLANTNVNIAAIPNNAPVKLSPTKDIIIYKDGNGDVVGTQDIDGKPGDKVTPNIPDGYFTGDITEVTVPECGIVTVNVVKKATSKGDVATSDALPTKNMIVYKDGNGDVVGIQEVEGKPGDKVTPNIPDGYFNGDVTEVTIPENGIVTVNVIKREISNGDVAETDTLPTKNVIIYKDKNGDVADVQEITGKPANKVKPNIPEGYWNGDVTEVTIPESGVVTINVVKKETSNGDVAETDALPTKNVIIYKDDNGDVVGTEEGVGKPDEKVKPNIPEGYWNGDVTDITIPESGVVTVTVVKKETSNGDAANPEALPTKNVIIYKDGNGDVVGTQEVEGKPGEKVTPNIPKGYFNGDTTEVTIPEDGTPITVNVVKKETSNGDAANPEALPTKNVIIYKDGNGDVVGTEEVDGKPGDKVKPNIPDGYYTGNTTEITIPESGIVTVNVVKKETSNGDSLIQPSLPVYTEPSDNNNDSEATLDVPNVPNSGNNKSQQGNLNTQIIERVANTSSDYTHIDNSTNVSSSNKQNTLPQTGEKDDNMVAVGTLMVSLGALMSGLYGRLRKRNKY